MFPQGRTGHNVVVRPLAGDGEDSLATLEVAVGDCPGRAPRFSMKVYDSVSEVKIYPYTISKEGRQSAVTEERLQNLIDEVNVIFRQAGMHFSKGGPIVSWENDVWAEAGLTDGIVARRIRGQLGSAREDGVNVFFIPGRGEKLRRKWREPIGTTESPKCMIIIRESASGASLAHEIGHCCGLCDIYVERASDRSTSADRVVIRNFMEDDWNNGTGCRFYPTGLSMEFLSKRLLMYGVGGEAAFDIPLGPIEGMAKDKGQGKLNVGQSKGVFTRLPRSR